MPIARRPFPLLALSALAVVATGCGAEEMEKLRAEKANADRTAADRAADVARLTERTKSLENAVRSQNAELVVTRAKAGHAGRAGCKVTRPEVRDRMTGLPGFTGSNDA